MKPPLASIVALGALSLAPGAEQTRVLYQARDEDPHISLDVTRVNLLFTVADRKGRFVTDLAENDFEVLEDQRIQRILEFSSESDLPLRVGILLDASNSVRDRFHFIQEAAVEFLIAALRPRRDKALVVSFDTSAELVSDFSDDPKQLATLIRDLRPGGGTSLYDAIYDTCRDKLSGLQPRDRLRLAMVVLSDGEDNQSRAARDQALEMALKSGVVIYTISTNAGRQETHGDKVLQYLATETGGLALYPFKIQGLARSFERIGGELRHQYSIYYRPEPLKNDGRYHAVSLQVKSRKGLVIRVRKGYYAPKL